MSSYKLDATGLTVSDFDTIYEDLKVGIKSIYGNDIDLGDNTPDGQKIGLEAKAIADFGEFLLSFYNSFDPDYAMGEAMDKILKLNGMQRSYVKQSTVDITLICSKTVSLPNDYKLKDTLSQIWVIDEAKTLIAGTHLITFKSEIFGKIEAPIGTVTDFETIVLGVTSVTNSAVATVGTDEETDEEMRVRRNGLLMRNSTSTVGGLLGKLHDFCSEVKVYENKSGTLDTERNIEAHGLWVICEGGDVSDIAKTIALESVGNPLKGAIIEEYEENIARGDGTTLSYTHTVNFDRPNIINIFIRFNVHKKTITSTIDTVVIKQNLSNLKYKINEDITATELYSAIYYAESQFIASDIEVSLDGTAWVSTEILSGYGDKLTIVEANITITEI